MACTISKEHLPGETMSNKNQKAFQNWCSRAEMHLDSFYKRFISG
jgi:hypothetical protein